MHVSSSARCMHLRSKPKSFLDATRRDWQFACYAWLLRNGGGYAKFLDTTLVLPTIEHFPDRGMKGHAAVAAIFRRVRDHAGMAEWPCVVEPASDVPRIETGDSGRIPVFTYQRELLDPVALVATFARDLARYLIATIDEPVPGGEELREPAIEMGAIYLGFGLFVANSALRDVRYELNEGELAHALAVFCVLRGLPPESADEYLNPHLRKYLRLALRDLAQHQASFEKLRAMSADAALAERTLPALTR
jgi:hypothetical protein